MYTLNGAVWYPFCPNWLLLVSGQNLTCSCKWPLHVSGKITTVPRLFSEYLPQMEQKKTSDYECTH